MDDFNSPQLICKVEDNELGFKGFLVIDSLLGGHCAGGVRMTPTVTEEEIIQLAGSMTKKFGFLNIHMGGAKSGIVFPCNESPERRKAILTAFGKKLGFILRAGIYYPGTDIGTKEEDIQLIERGAGINAYVEEGTDNRDSGYFTALAAVSAAKEIAKFTKMDVSKTTVAVEGFGKVGRSLAREISKQAMVVGISTIKGAIYNHKGLDVERLYDDCKKCGEDVVHVYQPAEKISVEDLLSADIDILFLCGKPKSITPGNVYKVKAKIVIGAGNLCFDNSAEEILHQQGIYVFPDFITSCGGVLGLTLKEKGLSAENIDKVIREDFSEKIKQFIELSWGKKQSPFKIADDIVRKNIERMKLKRNQKNQNKLSLFLNLLINGQWKSLISKVVTNVIPSKYYHFQKIQKLIMQRARDQFRTN